MRQKRPHLVAGDVCRISKRGRKYRRNSRWLKNSFVVLKVVGSGGDGHSKVYCTVTTKDMTGRQITHKVSFARNELWFTGYNIHNKTEKPASQKPVTKQFREVNGIRNNDGRNSCYVCGEPTKVILGAMSTYNCCSNPACKWFNN